MKYLTTKSDMFSSKDQLSGDTLKTLERMDLDRQILFREKIDVLLEEKDEKIDLEQMKRTIHDKAGEGLKDKEVDIKR